VLIGWRLWSRHLLQNFDLGIYLWIILSIAYTLVLQSLKESYPFLLLCIYVCCSYFLVMCPVSFVTCPVKRLSFDAFISPLCIDYIAISPSFIVNIMLILVLLFVAVVVSLCVQYYSSIFLLLSVLIFDTLPFTATFTGAPS